MEECGSRTSLKQFYLVYKWSRRISRTAYNIIPSMKYYQPLLIRRGWLLGAKMSESEWWLVKINRLIKYILFYCSRKCIFYDDINTVSKIRNFCHRGSGDNPQSSTTFICFRGAASTANVYAILSTSCPVASHYAC